MILFVSLNVLLMNLVRAEIPDPSKQILHHRCNLYDDEFWRAYSWNFKNSSEINIITLITRDSKSVIEEFITEMLTALHEVQAQQKLSFYITTYRLRYISNPSMLKNNTNLHCDLTEVLQAIGQEVENKNTTDNLSFNKEYILQERIRRFSADLNYAFNLVVWDIEDFFQFIGKRFRKVFPNPRGVYVVAFISPSKVDLDDIEYLFRKIWEDFGVLNIVFQLPCSCDRRELFMYNPFETVNGSWGMTKKFRIADAEKDSTEFTNSLKTLKGYPLNVAMFPRLPTMVEPPKCMREDRIYQNLSRSNGFAGLDGMIMGALAEILDFRPVMAYTSGDYGFSDNGTYSGIFGEVAYRRVDISFNSRFVESIDSDLIEYLTPVVNDKFCLIVPKSSRVPQYLSIFRCFDVNTWILILFTYFVSALYWCAIQPLNLGFRQRKHSKDIADSFLEVFSIFISVPVHLAICNNHRLFLIACMVFNIIIVGSFQGQLVNSFSRYSYYPDIDTLEDFEKSGMTILAASKSTGNIFGDDGTHLMKELNKKIVIANRSGIIKAMSEGNMVATFERKTDARLRIIMYDAENAIHICEECPRSYYFTYIVPKGSPYLHVFNIVITLLRESGLVTKWKNDVIDGLIIHERIKRTYPTTERNKQFSMSNLQIPFYILVIGHILALIVFITEIVVHKK